MLGILRDLDAPVERRARDREVLEPAPYKTHHLVAARVRADEIGLTLVEVQQLVLVGRQLEEIALLLDPFDRRALRAAADIVLADDGLLLGVIGLVAHRIPAGIGVDIDVAVVLHAAPDFLHGPVMRRLRGADEAVERDVEALVHLLEARRVAGREIVGRHSLAGRGLDHLLSVLVGAGQEEHVLAVEPLEARQCVGRDRLIGVADMRLTVRISDRGRDVEHVAAIRGGHRDGCGRGSRRCGFGLLRRASFCRCRRLLGNGSRRQSGILCRGCDACCGCFLRRRLGGLRCGLPGRALGRLLRGLLDGLFDDLLRRRFAGALGSGPGLELGLGGLLCFLGDAPGLLGRARFRRGFAGRASGRCLFRLLGFFRRCLLSGRHHGILCRSKRDCRECCQTDVLSDAVSIGSHPRASKTPRKPAACAPDCRLRYRARRGRSFPIPPPAVQGAAGWHWHRPCACARSSSDRCRR
ncbi:hypothetical protein ABIF13_002788 [Bradyrhizobium elkanii]